MEIKVGDKVRVREDAPEMYFFGCNYDNSVCKVILVDRDNAVITQVKNGSFAIPTKYLIKVEDEPKEPKFKVGDKVVLRRYNGVTVKAGSIGVVWGMNPACKHRYDVVFYGGGLTLEEEYLVPYTEPTAPKIEVGSDELVDKQVWNCKLKQHGVIKRIANGCAEVFTQYGEHKVWSLVDLFDEYDEPFGNWKSVQPKGQTEAEEVARIRQMEAELDEFRKAELDKVLHPEKYHTYEVKVDNVFLDWQRYEADLAKEIALKITNKKMDNDPKEAAEYAVSVAKAVVENLKKK